MYMTVQLVCIPPMQEGYGLGQIDDGRVVRFSGTRQQLVDLCTALRQAHLEGNDHPRVEVEAYSLTEVREDSPDYETWHLARRYR
ncbi:MAG: hypothetical protein ACXVAM_07030 [Vulcanimicrobiaceae bacterium]